MAIASAKDRRLSTGIGQRSEALAGYAFIAIPMLLFLVLNIGSILYAGFHGGWNGDPSKRLLGLTASTGATTAFAPATNGILGVFDLAQAASSGRLVAVGDFKDMGNTHNLHGVAIFD